MCVCVCMWSLTKIEQALRNFGHFKMKEIWNGVRPNSNNRATTDEMLLFATNIIVEDRIANNNKIRSFMCSILYSQNLYDVTVVISWDITPKAKETTRRHASPPRPSRCSIATGLKAMVLQRGYVSHNTSRLIV